MSLVGLSKAQRAHLVDVLTNSDSHWSERNMVVKTVHALVDDDAELTLRAYAGDKCNIGTERYLGLAYFWHYEYRFELRDATEYQRRVIHQKLIDKGLDLDGRSSTHADIIEGTIHRGMYRAHHNR